MGSYLWEMVRVLLALAGVCVLAWVSLRGLARRGIFPSAAQGTRVRVVERTPLDGRRTLYTIEADGRAWLVGTGDSGPPALITELEGPAGDALAPVDDTQGTDV